MAREASHFLELFAGLYEGFDGAGPRLYRAPGRVNLIGEHTDYNQGFVLPVALELACYAASSPNEDGVLRVYSQDRQEGRQWPVEALQALPPEGHWSDYVVGVAQQLGRLGYEIRPANVLLSGTIPVGAGLSSSAAIEVASALALLEGREIEPIELVRACHRAENEFVGLPCGMMDQYISVLGQEHAALRIDCRDLTHQIVPLPGAVGIFAVNSMVKHELGKSAYRDRVRECGEAVELIRRRYANVRSLRDVTSADIEGLVTGVPLRRARHVTTENERVDAFVAACERGDPEKMGSLLAASHESLRKDYEVSCAELDFLVEEALKIPGVLGARMTGGGFGGCTVNLLHAGAGERFSEEITRRYRDRFGAAPEVYECRPAAGAGAID
ncbi:MAG: galactokinase [Bryobacteraceae bacterium]